MKTFNDYLDDAIESTYYKRLFERLNPQQRLLLRQIALDLMNYELHEREKLINRLFIDNLTPPKNHGIIIEILAGANSKAFFAERKANSQWVKK